MKDYESVTDKLNTILDGRYYFVGGVVRDQLLGLRTKDIDVSTAILPDEVIGRLKAATIKPVLTGKKYGTIGCKIDDYEVQITTFRKESYAQGSRKPLVEHTDDIASDLSRRDFTINALAIRDGEIIDLFGGINDIKNHRIKSLGNASERFTADPLRMLRAFRFASELGFTIDADTLRAIDDDATNILLISKERVADELDKILLGDYFKGALMVFTDAALFKYLLPELYITNPGYLKSNANAELSKNEEPEQKLAQRWKYLFDVLIDDKKSRRDPYFESELLAHIAKYYRWSTEKTRSIQEYFFREE